MKNTILAITIALTGSLANAKINIQCAQSMHQVAHGYLQVKAMTPTVEISESEKEILLQGWNNAAEVSALTCMGLAELEMERSLRGKMGLLSEETVKNKSTKIYDEAILYYKTLTEQ